MLGLHNYLLDKNTVLSAFTGFYSAAWYVFWHDRHG